jgi:GTP cyclohydrolase IA
VWRPNASSHSSPPCDPARDVEARRVIVVIEAEHPCMTMRGVHKPGAKTITSAICGSMYDAATRSEAMSVIMHGTR